ncbi:MAG: ATP-binding protein, partial [Byssovorax sp.]
IELAPDLPRAGGDWIQLQQVLLNLIVNALDAVSRCPPDARLVVVRTRVAERGRIELSVMDSGEGFADANIARIFEPFFTTKAQGLGIGLAISRAIVEAHGGRLWAEDRRPGEGATLRCTLPVWEEDASGAR